MQNTSMNAVHAANSEHADRTLYSYIDCLKGAVPVPQNPAEKFIFQLLMVGGMVTFMATINGVLHSGLSFFSTAHWMYPLIFCLAFLVRVFIGDKVVGAIAGRFVLPKFEGTGRNVAMTLLNVAVMATIMGSVVTMLLNGPHGYFAELVQTLPVTALAALTVNFLIVAPAVKLIYANHIEPVYGPRIVAIAQRYAMPWMAIFSN